MQPRIYSKNPPAEFITNGDRHLRPGSASRLRTYVAGVIPLVVRGAV